ncbi:MAG: redoxin domain-containing protein [Acidobacteriota bacterium]|nr:redoxin domain-containing protein [Acidobacteriota bacterium]
MRAQLRVLLVLVTALGAVLALSGTARADGDPGSDVLVYQPLFMASDSGISVREQVQLGNLVHAADKAGFRVRVAIIAKRDDLGAVTGLWQRPQAYARFLGVELSLAYKGRLLVVMPNGLGFNWPGHSTAASYTILDRIRTGSTVGLATATHQAIAKLAAAAGVDLAANSPATPRPRKRTGHRPAPRAVHSGPVSTRALALIVLVLLVAALVAARLLYRRHRAAIHVRIRRLAAVSSAHRGASLGLTMTAGVAVLAAVLLVASPSPQVSSARALANNPVLDSGTPLDRPARDFTLTDQFGRAISLRRFRGRVVILAFNDSECTTMCPLTTTAMLDAKAMLGPAGARVQLLGVDANPRATSIEDVWSYSQVHGMLHAWEFLTGSLPQLERVWRRYSIGVQISHHLVDHSPAIFVITPAGRIAKLFLTQQSYAAVGQLAQLLAAEVSNVLPAHPAVRSHLSYSHISGISPMSATSAPRAGGGRVELGPGRARMVLFFATWDRQITGLAGGLEGLKRYQSLALRRGLPQLTGIDEGSVEPRGALPSFMRRLPSRLNYPVAVDRSGRLADGYEVNGQPWLMLLNATGQIAFYYSVAALGWPTTAKLAHLARVALERVPATNSSAALKGSPPPLAALHHQASQIVGGYPALMRRIRSLRGYPIVLNVWASWCVPCRAEFKLFQAAAYAYGRRVAFLGANADDSAGDAQAFLEQHRVSYPSYSVSTTQLGALAQIAGLPTTIFIDKRGKVLYVHSGQYGSAGILDADIVAHDSGSA